MIIKTLLWLAAVYLTCGLVFAAPFVWRGVAVIDPQAARGTWGFKLLIIPGTVVFWPLLARRWAGKVIRPPEETNAHRRLARKAVSR